MMTTILQWLQTHGAVTAIVIYNIAMYAVAQIFIALGKMEPTWIQTISDVGIKIAQALSANPPTPKS